MKAHDVLQSSSQVISQYLKELDGRGIGKAHSPKELQSHTHLQIDAKPSERAELEAALRTYLDYSVGTLHPSFMNQLFSGLQPWSIAGELAALVTNSTMATFEAAPVATLMERELIKTLSSFAGWGQGEGIMVTGGSNANLVGLLMARNKLHPQIRQNGFSAQPLTAYVSEESHYSYEKAFNILGLGLKNLRKIKSTGTGAMDPEDLVLQITHDRKLGMIPFFVGATAGTTVLGAFDRLELLSPICRREGLWLHVDGAWGGSVLVSKRHRHLMQGIEQADSLGWDHHKMLGMGLVSSFFLTPHRGALLESHHGGGSEYIFHDSESGQFDFGKSSLQCGRRSDAVKTWFAWKSQGLEGMERYVDRLMDNTQRAAFMIQDDPRFELLHKPELLNVCFKVKGVESEPAYRRLREALMQQGLAMVNIATRRGETFIRLILAHPDQREEHVAKFLEHLIQAAKNLKS